MKRWLPLALWLFSASAVAQCFEAAGLRYGIDPLLLAAIAEVESSGRHRAVNHNADGSRDVGLMQINSYHFPRLVQRGITEARLQNDACLSVEVGASILQGFIERHGYNWTAVGAYNAGSAAASENKRRAYARKVWVRYRQLMAVPR